MNKTLSTITAGMAVLALFTSCDHKDLCFDHDQHALR